MLTGKGMDLFCRLDAVSVSQADVIAGLGYMTCAPSHGRTRHAAMPVWT